MAVGCDHGSGAQQARGSVHEQPAFLDAVQQQQRAVLTPPRCELKRELARRKGELAMAVRRRERDEAVRSL